MLLLRGLRLLLFHSPMGVALPPAAFVALPSCHCHLLPLLPGSLTSEKRLCISNMSCKPGLCSYIRVMFVEKRVKFGPHVSYQRTFIHMYEWCSLGTIAWLFESSLTHPDLGGGGRVLPLSKPYDYLPGWQFFSKQCHKELGCLELPSYFLETMPYFLETMPGLLAPFGCGSKIGESQNGLSW